MIDRGSVAQKLEKIHAVAISRDQLYINHMSMADFNLLLREAITLLKDRKPVVTTNAYGKKFYKCANCGFDFELYSVDPRVKVCRFCGQGVKWDD